MFDATTAALLRSAPAMPSLNPELIPAFFTAQYANLAAARLRGEDTAPTRLGAAWSLERLADAYELLASLTGDPAVRRPAAFVAATAQQILARRQTFDDASQAPIIDRDRVDPALAAALLFLSAEQYADANEAANAIRIEGPDQLYEARILAEHIADLARGRLGAILTRSIDWRRPSDYDDLETRALASLLETLATGVELLAAQILNEDAPAPSSGRYDSGAAAFNAVLQASAVRANGFMEGIESNSILTYAGPHHLASLLQSTADGLVAASLLAVPPPSGADQSTWAKWLRSRAEAAPYVWPNHREAIAKQFHETGTSAVVVLPTGAGKTTVSSLKIAGVLARGKKVAFLAPTHALVDQLTDDLQQMFPVGVMGSVVSNDFDLLLLDSAQLRDIEVMTPERCLAMLSFAPEAFQDVGLLVFDECHLLSPEMGRIPPAQLATSVSAANAWEPVNPRPSSEKMSHLKSKDRDQAPASTLLSQPLRMKPLLKAKELKRLTSECLACLIGIMEASPNKRTHTKAQLRQEARKIWPHLSLREFEHLRLLAIDETGAETWRHSGAPRKEPQNKR
jgi:hypothetical protein